MGQVVLIVIDALRVDFVLPNEKLSKLGLNLDGNRPKIDYINSLLEDSNDAIAFIAEAHSPTVTLPRIKVKIIQYSKYIVSWIYKIESFTVSTA